MSLISPTLAERIEQARQAQLRAQKAARQKGWRLDREQMQSRQARWHVEEPAEPDSENWLLSYLDLITLLLAMLVVMLAVVRLHGGWREAGSKTLDLVGSVDARGLPAYDGEYARFDAPRIPAAWAHLPEPGPRQDEAAAAPAADTQDGTVVAPPAPALKAPSKESLGLADLGDSVDVIINAQSVSFRISNELLFPSGQATLSPSGLDLIKRLARILEKNDYPVSVEGHSDNVPILTRQFASNWELSASRATSVLRELVSDGIAPQRLRAVGYADTRPIDGNDTAAGRAANRRVELIMDIPPHGPAGTAQAAGASAEPAAASAPAQTAQAAQAASAAQAAR
ncbi:OmpA family protein [Achromobacter sp. Marseille-Q4962]|uniref:OmpA/MotB family protein n=1 Tax=Achromobacter sp. Marseille-Q4962 TaxID=2942202 RepID=UPI0020743AF4|nr:OmpA family protein [Achromobacter sp. Marseille-Q4962]